jgi:hypothetical protein
MNTYFRRFLKFFLFMVALLFVMLFLFPLIRRGISFEQTYHVIAGDKKMLLVLVIIFIYGFLYPVLSFGKKERHINGSFADNRDTIEHALENLDYIKQKETESVIRYKRKSIVTRILMFGEDGIELNIHTKPLVFSGPRRDLQRIDRALDAVLLG